MPTRPAQRAAGGRAYEFVKAAILAGEYQPGASLTEGDLAALIGVSRTPVREALLRLETEGLVSLHPKKGALVRIPSAQEIADVLEARAVVELLAVNRGWLRRNELTQQLQPLVEDVRRYAAAGTVLGFVSADRAFHGFIVEVAGNATVAGFYKSLRDRQAGITCRHCAGHRI